MDKLSFFKENFKKGNLIVCVRNDETLGGIYELLETYKEGYRWIEVQRYYRNGVFSPLVSGFNIEGRLLGEPVSDEYVVIKEFYYD